MDKSLDNRSEKSERPMQASSAAEFRRYVSLAVGAHGGPQKQAIPGAARSLRITPRRVLAVLHDEVRRVWSDEMDHARTWYRDWLAAEERRLDLRARQLATERARLDEQDRRDGIA